MKRSLSRRRAAVAARPTVGGGGGGAARFPGDPGPGKILTGATVWMGTDPAPVSSDGNQWLDENSGINHLLKRIYYVDLWSRNTIINYRNSGKMPSIAWRLNADATTIAAIAGGSRDAAVTAEAVWAAGQGYPIYTAFWHEPEDNFTTSQQAADFRAAYRRIVNIFRANGATNVVWCGVAYMASWTFIPASGRNWYWWDPDWKGTLSGGGGTTPNASDWYTGGQSVLDVLTFDTYTPTIGSTNYHEFSEDMEPCLTKMIAAGREILPWMILEMGTKQTSTLPAGGWTGFWQRAFRYMRDNNGVGYVYYNTSMNNFANAPLAAERFDGYMNAQASEAAYIVSTRPPDAGVGGVGAGVAFVGAGVGGGNLTTVTPPMPVGIQAGDVALAFWTHSTTATVTADPTAAGWDLLASNASTTGNMIAKIYTKVLTGGDASPSVTMSGLTRHGAVLVVYRGVNTADPFDGTPSVDITGTAGTTHTNPTYTTVNPNCVVVTSIHERATNIDTDWTEPTGYVERGDTMTLAVGSAGNITAVADNGLALVPAGTAVTPPAWTGDDPNATGGTDQVLTYTLALRAS